MNSSSQIPEVKIESTRGSQIHLTPNQRAWRRFLHNRPAVFSSFFLITMVLLILIWPLLSKPRIAIHLPKAMTQDTVAMIAKRTGRTPEEARRLLADKQPIGRLITSEEVADAVWFCVANPGVTGQGINVDGGAIQS